jgi:hypothetical protein
MAQLKEKDDRIDQLVKLKMNASRDLVNKETEVERANKKAVDCMEA